MRRSQAEISRQIAALALAGTGAVPVASKGADSAGLFVAVGHQGQRLVSRDGRNWEHQQLGQEGETYQALCFGGGRCVTVGRYGGSNLMAVTRDGVQWQTIRHDAKYSRYLQGLGYGNGGFLAVGGDPGAVGASRPFVMQTKDGASWSDIQEVSGKEVLRRIAYGNGRFVAVGDRGRRAASPDGLIWQDAPNAKAIDTLIDVTFGRGIFVGVGLHGLRMVSEDGLNWSERLTGEEGEHLNSVIWIGDRFVAVGQGATYFSDNGRKWERQPNRNTPLVVAYGNGIFVGSNWKGRLLLSPDAVQWEQVHRCEHHVEAVAFGTFTA